MKSKAVLILSTLLVLLAISQAYGVKEVYSEYGTLKDVIENANPGETIFLHNGTYYVSGIVVDKPLTIVGEDRDGVVIDAQREGPIFYIDAYTDVKLINLTLINGNGAEGGAINNNGQLEVENCAFVDNYASENGGAIFNSGTLTINGCRFENNYVGCNDGESGGAIYNSHEGQVTINNSVFVDNSADFGGAIDNEGYLTIENCVFENNTAGASGGAIHNGGELRIMHSTFTSNIAKEDGVGGAISNDGNRLIIDNCIFDSNVATYGGAISTSNNLKVTNSIFMYNYAGMDGGAIGVDPRVEDEAIILVDNSNIFIDNLPNDSNIPLNNTLNYSITLTNTGKSTITIKCYISIYTNSVNGKKVGYKEVTITLKPKETKRIYLGKYPAGHIVSGTIVVKNPSKKRIQLNLQVKYEIEGFNPEIRKISNYIAPRKEFKYNVKYRVNEYGSIEVS